MTGLFITFEGGEGAGKTTLISQLLAALEQENIPAIQTREPGGTSFGKHIRSILLDQHDCFISNRSELLLFLADRANHIEEIIKPALESNQVVLCDRFNDSTYAYQGIHQLVHKPILDQLVNFATEGLEPHITFYLDLPPEEGLKRAKRISNDRMEQKDLDFHHLVRENFLALAKEYPNRIIVIDAMQTIEQVFMLAITHVRKYIHECIQSSHR